MTPDTLTHPSSMSEADKAALIASDPSAFDTDPDDTDTGADLDSAAGAGDTDTELATQDEDAGANAAAAAEAEAAAAAAVEAAPAEQGKKGAPDLIPKARFDEVNGELKDIKKWREALSAPPADRDFEAETATLKQQYDDGDIDIHEYMAGRDAVTVAKAQHAAQERAYQVAQVQQVEQVQQAWNDKVDAWKGLHPEFLANPIRTKAVSDLFDTLGADPNLTDDQLIEAVQAAAFEAFNWQGAPAKLPTAPDPHAARNAADLKARTEAMGAPASIAAGGAGVGGRGQPANVPDMATLKPGEFSKLSKTQQEALLGEGAL